MTKTRYIAEAPDGQVFLRTSQRDPGPSHVLLVGYDKSERVKSAELEVQHRTEDLQAARERLYQYGRGTIGAVAGDRERYSYGYRVPFYVGGTYIAAETYSLDEPEQLLPNSAYVTRETVVKQLAANVAIEEARVAGAEKHLAKVLAEGDPHWVPWRWSRSEALAWQGRSELRASAAGASAHFLVVPTRALVKGQRTPKGAK